MYIHSYVYTSIHLSIHLWIYLYIDICVYTYGEMDVCLSLSLSRFAGFVNASWFEAFRVRLVMIRAECPTIDWPGHKLVVSLLQPAIAMTKRA